MAPESLSESDWGASLVCSTLHIDSQIAIGRPLGLRHDDDADDAAAADDDEEDEDDDDEENEDEDEDEEEEEDDVFL